MATQLDLQEQEQLDAVKAFWNRYGNLITGVMLVLALSVAGWQGWQWMQRDQGFKAGAMFDELDRAAQAGDVERTTRVADDLRQRYPSTAVAQQGVLLAARVQFEKGQADAARDSLRWLVDNGKEPELVAVARLRLAGVLLQQQQLDEALKVLDAPALAGFEALVADRRGDVLLAQGKAEEARRAYQTAWAGMPEAVNYRQLVEAKLTALGAPPGVASAAVAGAASAPAASAGARP